MNILTEEAVIFKVKQEGNSILFGKIVEYAGKGRAEVLVNRLIKRNILEKANDKVYLKAKNYKFTVPAFKSNQ